MDHETRLQLQHVERALLNIIHFYNPTYSHTILNLHTLLRDAPRQHLKADVQARTVGIEKLEVQRFQGKLELVVWGHFKDTTDHSLYGSIAVFPLE